MRDLICFAHRGASGTEPENTLRAVATALRLGASWVEVDVYLIEGELIVFHDETLERRTDGAGRVVEQSLAYLRSLDAGQGERIPLLGEVLDLIGGHQQAGRRPGINIELKGPDTAGAVADLTRTYVQRHGWSWDRFLISSFDLPELRRLKALRPELPVGPLVAVPSRGYIRLAREMGAASVHVGRAAVHAHFVVKAHAAGLKVLVYTVNSAAEVERMRSLGVDGVFTDYPELVGGG